MYSVWPALDFTARVQVEHCTQQEAELCDFPPDFAAKIDLDCLNLTRDKELRRRKWIMENGFISSVSSVLLGLG